MIVPPPPTPTPVPTITAKIKDKNDNNITATERVVMVGVPTKLMAESISTTASFSWSAPNGNLSSMTARNIQASWSTEGIYTISLTATQGAQSIATVQTTIKVQSPVFEKIEAVEVMPKLFGVGGCIINSYTVLTVGCENEVGNPNSRRGITITASAKASVGDISNKEEAKLKFVQLINPYRTRRYNAADSAEYCYTERLSENDLSQGWKLDGGNPYGGEDDSLCRPRTVDGVPFQLLIGVIKPHSFLSGKKSPGSAWL